MVWQYVLTVLSAAMFFGFVALCVHQFGWLSCYSAYGVKWEDSRDVNLWQFVTIWSAFLIVPVLLQTGEGNPYQFLGFLAPTSLLLVGATPDYATVKWQSVVHPVGAIAAAAFIALYAIAIPHLLWVVLVLVAVAAFIGWKQQKNTLLFWLEMAMYASTYVIILAII